MKTVKEQIIDYVKQHPNCTTFECQESIGCTIDYVRTILRKLVIKHQSFNQKELNTLKETLQVITTYFLSNVWIVKMEFLYALFAEKNLLETLVALVKDLLNLVVVYTM